MTQQEMQFLVPRKLKELEKEYGIRVLYAVESGSRAWGTDAPDSDFDIRFLYIRSREDYLRLEPLRDVL
jgi:predicted nucleotidyltransferase